MSRKPVHLESAGPRNDRQTMWQIIRNVHTHEGNTPFTVNTIRGRLKGSTPRDKIRAYLNSLVKAGYLSGTKPLVGRETVYQMIRDAGVEAPRVRKNGEPVTQGQTQQRIWKTLKIIKGWISLRALIAQISTEAEQAKKSTVKSYLKHLEKAGYIIVKGRGDSTEYCLVPARYSGPKAPMVQRTKHIYDPNTGEVVWREEVRHD